MSEPTIVAFFLFLVFAPCLVAFFGSAEPDNFTADASDAEDLRHPFPKGRRSLVLDAAQPEAELSEKFVIRSFAKGIAQHRFVVRDTESGVKLHISQVREAAIELMKQGGVVAAREFALVVAATAAAMTSVSDAVVIATRDTLDAARRAFDWFSLSDTLTDERALTGLRAGPDLYGPEHYGPDLYEQQMAELDRARSSGERRAVSDRWRRVEPRAA